MGPLVIHDAFNSYPHEWGGKNTRIGPHCGKCEAVLFCLTGLYPPGIGVPVPDKHNPDFMWYRAEVRTPIDQYRRAFKVKRSTCPKWQKLDHYDDDPIAQPN